MKNFITVVTVFLFNMLLSQAQTTTLKAGDAAPDFKLKNVDGKEVSFASFKKAK
jgi:peroxiredoxin